MGVRKSREFLIFRPLIIKVGIEFNIQFGTSGQTGVGVMLRVAEAQPVDLELVKMELSVISAVTLATLLKQLFVKTKIAQVCQMEI